ncbi:hypothetical protein DACRYDRAFT_113641 [Dacryopinax primogenitus]|uniref:SAC domain-containing protein n=1 Tax=Dacryopinax primogenitus (strain DJM 731) TaxID=1858805 RepID=M5GEN5_DACPD|nr:uncharacterized protein DACRYDRAFT_113641 [Dacryopinax primogenitus]EJU05562.1 hypothetical protein DACRYDRAFT_113641 [Dacryopinax primogenitus]
MSLFSHLRSKEGSIGSTNELSAHELPPPVPHPSPHSKLALISTPEGLIITPAVTGADSVEIAKLAWGKEGKVSLMKTRNPYRGGQPTVPGIVGVLHLFNLSYLLVVSSAVQVGNLLDPSRTIYCVKDVTAIPLDETKAAASLKLLTRNVGTATPLPEEDEDDEEDESDTDVEAASFTELDINQSATLPRTTVSSSTLKPPPSTTSPGRPRKLPDMARRLSFWRKVARRQQPPPSPITPLAVELGAPTVVQEMNPAAAATLDAMGGPEEVIGVNGGKGTEHGRQERLADVERKVVRECIRLWTQGGMFFAYDFDITRGLQRKHDMNNRRRQQEDILTEIAGPKSSGLAPQIVKPFTEPNPQLPLWRRVDHKYWWNRNLMGDFLEAGLHNYILPIMNGFFEMSTFHLPIPSSGEERENVPVDFTIISRRACQRPGLRYQRRGIDDHGNVANFVETEAIISVERDEKRNIFAHTQIRGSIPLYWSQPQPGLQLKPIPRLDRPLVDSSEIMRKHFTKLSNYWPVTIVNLAELTGKESVVTLAYRELAQGLNMKDVKYREFDFHHECKGMKYENISKLIDTLQSTFASQGFFWANGDDVLNEQRGTFRTNCIDCLDRTNVVQSAFSRYVLEQQLQAAALLGVSHRGKTEQEIVFNRVWANNGDAISRSYAGTSALKGDYTRTGKRDINGMLNDGMNSLARLYSSAFADYFTQAVIDYFMGNRRLSVFSEFLEKLQSTDPGERLHLSKIRADAIETCAGHVLDDDDILLGGWTLFSPAELDTKMGKSFEEKILLLSPKALYISSYDYALDKVVMVTRVPLNDIVSIQKGAYILSTLQEAARDPAENYGLLLTWKTSHLTRRMTSYSLRNKPDLVDVVDVKTKKGLIRTSISRNNSTVSLGKGLPEETQFAAFKALPTSTAASGRDLDAVPVISCKHAVDVIADTIVRACKGMEASQKKDFVRVQDIISLEEARRETTVYAKLEYYLKRRLWL